MTIHAGNFIDGQPQPAGGARWAAVTPSTGDVLEVEFGEATREEVAVAAAAAAAAQDAFAAASPAERSALLRAIGAELEQRRTLLVDRADAESALGTVRLESELTRAIVQFEAFADLVAVGEHYAARIDESDPGARPAPRPDIRKMLVPLGPVAVFGASNFPFAFSTAGGDTASALAAGCPVIVKGHPSHPGTSALAAEAITAAVAAAGLPGGVFALLQGRSPELSRWLVEQPEIAAVGFTGSQRVGRLLGEIAAARPTPIPVYAEMGSLNPVFVTSAAIAARGDALAGEVVGSALLGSGQFCTKPGIVVVPDAAAADAFVARLGEGFAAATVGPLLNAPIADGLRRGLDGLRGGDPDRSIVAGACGSGPMDVAPTLVTVDWSDATGDPRVLEEHFGPVAVVVRAPEAEFAQVAAALDGQLTATVHAVDTDDATRRLVSQLARIAGRVIWNGMPTGVAVTAAMHHGGPWPATSSALHTSVGLDAIWRFLRPVAFQGFPAELLPPALQSHNPWQVPQRRAPVTGASAG